MKRFEFSLERLRRLRQQQEQIAALRQQQARLTLEQLRAEIARLQADIEQVAAAAPTFLATTDALAFRTAQARRLEQLRSLVSDAGQRETQAEKEWNLATARRVALAQEVEILQSLRAEKYEEYRRERAHHEQQVIEEIVMRRWNSDGHGAALNKSAREDLP